ncbi:MAG: AAA family ATPase [Candidatus Aegiribacteria sp. MLS_C]|nr:MAG: AAA family ATPase [Candidatus Aegiribacteria sp. MLS_C]
MSVTSESAGSGAYWFVGASYGGTDDQTSRFLAEGIWQNKFQEKNVDLVKSIKAGDRIAIKSTYTRKHGLPFDNRGHVVSVMAIKATGTVTHNSGDGQNLKVDWLPLDSQREWYFYTYRNTVWRVLPGDWMADALIAFTFDNEPQDIDRFRNEPYWRERFGDKTEGEQRFLWTGFYEAVADKLLQYKLNRQPLVEGIHSIASRVDGLTYLQDHFDDGTTGALGDICPFTAMGIFNRGITDANRKAIAAELATFLGVEEPVPQSFEGIPVLNNQKSWFFGFHKHRGDDDIDALWEVFAKTIEFAGSDDDETRSSFAAAYNDAVHRFQVGWNLTMGLYWIRPWNFPTLEGQSRRYITKKLGITIGLSGPKNRCSADDYLSVMDTLETRFKEENYPVHSFPELSLAAWLYKDAVPKLPIEPIDGGEDDETVKDPSPIVSYSVDSILADGCFLDRTKLKEMLERLRTKRNLILQGPPGTGKTWLAKRLAFALMGERNDGRVRVLQFHPNLSYEDFIRGWRPSGDGKLALVDGPFMEMIQAASKEPSARHVVVIEEINRGNPAQIFGEMLTLLEVDKRTPDEALELCYPRNQDERIFIPDNLYVIGTMNIADRSIALVDLALRRRFAFIDLEPTLGDPWHDWVHRKWGIASAVLWDIERRINDLNNEISLDTSLGPQFRVGHSYVTPPLGTVISDPREWFVQVAKTEIGPLLAEYWFDDLDKARKATEKLIEGL